MRKVIFPTLLLLLGASNLASGLTLTLLTDNTRSASGALSFQAFKTCAPAVGNGCYNPNNSWYISNGVTGSNATWTWDGTTLTASGLFWTTSFISSIPSGQSVVSDRTVNLTINTALQTTTATSYNCIEGTFLANVGVNGCLGTSTGDNFASDSTAVYNVGGNANCVQRTVVPDDTSNGNTRGLFNAGPVGACDPVDGGYSLYTILEDSTATGGILRISNGVAIGNCITLGCSAEPAAAGAHFLTFAVVATAEDDGPINVRQEVPETINVLANDTGFINPVTVTVTTAPTKGTATVIGTSPGPQAGLSIAYTSNPGATGTDSFVYTVLDGNGTTSDTATVTVNILPFGANDDTATTTRNSATINISVGSNDVGFAEPVSVAITGAPSLGGTATPPAGTVTLANAIISYKPPTTAPGTGTPSYVETFTYEVTDDNGLTQTAVVTVTVSNTVPVAGPAGVTISTLGSAPGSLAGSFDAATLGSNSLGNTPSVITRTDGSNGTVVVTGTTVAYTPAATFFSGTDTFTYTITDADPDGAESATGTATVTIEDLTPTVSNRTATGNQGTTLNVTGAFTAGNGSLAQHSFSVQTQATSGTCAQPVVSGANITVAYTPDAGFSGSDSCVIRLEDGEGDGGNGTYSFTVNAVGGGGGGASLPASSSFDLWSLSLLAGLSWLHRRRLMQTRGS